VLFPCASATWLTAAPAWGVNQFQRIIANDADGNDSFGSSVGLSGNTAIIGAWHDDHPGKIDAGSAYIFRDGGGNVWGQIDQLFADDAVAGNNFGTSVAISGNTAIVGAPLKAGGGGAYIFRETTPGNWEQIDTVLSNVPVAGDQFGYSVAIDGNTAVVGAWKRGAGTGAAYVFRETAGDWVQVGTLTADDAAGGDEFGVSVAISGGLALVGSWADQSIDILAGSAYVFQEGGGGVWSQAAKLTPTLAPMESGLAKRFGASVALEGTTAVIGAIGDATGQSGAGAAYVFQRDGAMVWQQQDKLTPSDPAHNGHFGTSVDLSGNTVVVGGNEVMVGGQTTGAAYFYRRAASGIWNQVSKLTPSDGLAGDFYGYSSAVSGNVALVGSVLANDAVAGVDAGAGYLYNVPGLLLPGDFNNDNVVNSADYTTWRNTLGQTGPGLLADDNGDNVVNRKDYDMWKRNYGANIATGALSGTTVPEPATAMLLLLAGLLAGSRRSGRRH
jgi:hypothetical protein